MRTRLDRLRNCLTDAVENIVLLAVVDSTHAMARELISDMDDEEQHLAGSVIIADRQEHGEGRAGRTWASPSGGLYLSWLQSGLAAETIARLPLLAAVAAHAAIAELGVSELRIKWPNDLLAKGRKVAGILVFARHGEPTWAAVGLGVNVGSSPRLEGHGATPATCIADLLGRNDSEPWRERIACSFVNRLTESLADPAPALASWRTLLLQTPGDAVKVRLGSGEVFEGSLVAIEDEGYLRIRVGDEERVVSSGDLIER